MILACQDIWQDVVNLYTHQTRKAMWWIGLDKHFGGCRLGEKSQSVGDSHTQSFSLKPAAYMKIFQSPVSSKLSENTAFSCENHRLIEIVLMRKFSSVTNVTTFSNLKMVWKSTLENCTSPVWSQLSERNCFPLLRTSDKGWLRLCKPVIDGATPINCISWGKETDLTKAFDKPSLC